MAAKRNILVATMKQGTDGKALYESIKQYDMNVLDTGDKIYVYNFNNVSDTFIVKTLQECCKFGECKVILIKSAK